MLKSRKAAVKMKKFKMMFVFVISLLVSMTLVTGAMAVSRYCPECGRDTNQQRIEQDLNNGIDYPMYIACNYGTPNCRIKITAYRYTWWCTECQTDLYEDYVKEIKTHTNSNCPGA